MKTESKISKIILTIEDFTKSEIKKIVNYCVKKCSDKDFLEEMEIDNPSEIDWDTIEAILFQDDDFDYYWKLVESQKFIERVTGDKGAYYDIEDCELDYNTCEVLDDFVVIVKNKLLH